MGVLYVVLGFLTLLILIVVIRALCFKDKNNNIDDKEEVVILDDVVQKLGEMIKIPTISYEDKSKIDYEQYYKYINKVKELFPTVFEKGEWEITKELAFKIKIKGKKSDSPTVLMAHYDVVPVTEGWKHDPFLGEVVDGYLYGRGTLDTKITMACSLNAVEDALKKGYVPEQDLYLCYGANEEIFGDSQEKIVEWFKKEGIVPGLVFDEGGGVISNAFPGVKEDTAFLGMVEKGMVNIKLSYKGNGGHSSTPRKNGPAIRLAKALIKLEKNQMKPQLIKTTREMIDIMGRHSSFGLKIIFANMWLFEGLLKKIFQIASADTRALVQSTFAFTILNGGNQTNIIPNQVEANINVRVAPFDTIESIIEHVKKVIDDDEIEVTSFDERRTYKECSTDQDGYRKIRSTVYETYDNVVVAPFIMLGGTDAKYYCNVSPCVIRFSPMKVTNEDRKGIHGLDEQIKVESLLKCQEFYQRLLKKI